MNYRKIGGSSALLSAIAFYLVYFIGHAVPFTSIYLGNERLGHILFALIIFVIGTALIIPGMRYVSSAFFSKFFIGFGLFFIIGFTLFVFYRQATSFRGWAWALESLLIAWTPLFFLLLALLTLTRRKWPFQVLSFLFGALGAVTLLGIIRIVPKIGKAFSSFNTWDALTGLLLLLVLGFFCWSNLKAIKSIEPQD
jgi:hypothetical protein